MRLAVLPFLARPSFPTKKGYWFESSELGIYIYIYVYTYMAVRDMIRVKGEG